MRVRLLKAATAVLPGIGHHWCGPGTEIDIPDEHFDPETHEAVDASAPPAPDESHDEEKHE